MNEIDSMMFCDARSHVSNVIFGNGQIFMQVIFLRPILCFLQLTNTQPKNEQQE